MGFQVCTTLFFSWVVSIIMMCLVVHSACLRLDKTFVPSADMQSVELNLTCTADSVPFHYLSELTLDIGRDGDKPLAIVPFDGVAKAINSYGENIKVVGQINQMTGDSFLSVAIGRPKAGTYRCRLFFFDFNHQIKQTSVTQDVVVDSSTDTATLVRHLALKLTALETTVQAQKEIIDTLQEEKATDESDKLDGMLNQIAALEERASYRCAFLMGYDEKDKLNSTENMRFSREKVNIGKAYNATSGVFTAPRDGLYVFHVTIMTTNFENDYLNVHLEVNGGLIGQINTRSGDTWETSSTSAVTPLQAGDKVDAWINGYSGEQDYLWGAMHSTFSGYLIQAF